MSRGHANRGRGWEATCDAWHRVYAMTREPVWVIRTPPPVKHLSAMGSMRREGRSVVITPGFRKAGRRGGSTFAACYEAAGPPDYAGVVLGRGFAFDAKQQSSGDRFSFSNVKDHQATHLDLVYKAGGYSWLLVQLQLRSWLVWWDLLSEHWWRWKRHGGRPASLKPSDPDEGMEGIAERLPGKGWLPLVKARIKADAEGQSAGV